MLFVVFYTEDNGKSTEMSFGVFLLLIFCRNFLSLPILNLKWLQEELPRIVGHNGVIQ